MAEPCMRRRIVTKVLQICLGGYKAFPEGADGVIIEGPCADVGM
jgi:hypothetical protein